MEADVFPSPQRKRFEILERLIIHRLVTSEEVCDGQGFHCKEEAVMAGQVSFSVEPAKRFTIEQGSGESLEAFVVQAVKRCGWEDYACVMVRSHFHLALLTPETNLFSSENLE
ncbi:MAG: hypothetical protein ACFCU4_04095 [Puniceicoccaceae bacterium]